MEPLGILLYGYNSDDAIVIKKSVKDILNDEIILISGSKKENMKMVMGFINMPGTTST